NHSRELPSAQPTMSLALLVQVGGIPGPPGACSIITDQLHTAAPLGKPRPCIGVDVRQPINPLDQPSASFETAAEPVLGGGLRMSNLHNAIKGPPPSRGSCEAAVSKGTRGRGSPLSQLLPHLDACCTGGAKAR